MSALTAFVRGVWRGMSSVDDLYMEYTPPPVSLMVVDHDDLLCCIESMSDMDKIGLDFYAAVHKVKSEHVDAA